MVAVISSLTVFELTYSCKWTMDKQILVPLDSSPISKEVIQIANDWAMVTGSEIIFFHVNPKKDKSGKDQLEKLLDEQHISANFQAVSSIGITYQEIIKQEKSLQPDLIIMAAHSHTVMSRLFLGSNTDHVVQNANCSVYVYRRSAEVLKNRFIVPLDFTSINKDVVKFADDWASKEGAKIFFIHVATLPEFAHYNMEHGWEWDDAEIKSIEADETEKTRSFIEKIKPKSEYEMVIEYGKPYYKIYDLQKRINAKTIIMAAHSHSLLERII
ncbi:MAG: universal stress protein, partial [Deltaproteobacteria bacterium]|nr:universal stress protein [Deltaproteobacteria bacterium]